jgi:hypothetical protein
VIAAETDTKRSIELHRLGCGGDDLIEARIVAEIVPNRI